jgi:Glycosyl transferase family 2
MLSVIIATRNSERALVSTLAALVPGAAAGLVREVLIVDSGASDATAAVADAAGCDLLPFAGPLGGGLQAGAAKTRGPWLLFLRPGTVLDARWTGEVSGFVQQPPETPSAAVFRRATPTQSGLREALSLLGAALGAKPRPEQGLLIAKEFYRRIGGHSADVPDPEADLLRRIGRRRLITLSTGAFQSGRDGPDT